MKIHSGSFAPRYRYKSCLPVLWGFLLLLSAAAAAGQSHKVYLSPEIGLGLTSGYNHAGTLKLDPANPGYMLRPELRAGYFFDKRLSIFTGLGFGVYDYHMVISGNGNQDTIRQQEEHLIEIPLGIRYTSYNGRRPFKTRHYFAAGFRVCLLNDARYDYHSVDGSASGNMVQEADFNRLHLRFFAEAGLDIPMDYNSGILIGLSVSEGVTRNMSRNSPLTGANYGVLALSASFGVRIGL